MKKWKLSEDILIHVKCENLEEQVYGDNKPYMILPSKIGRMTFIPINDDAQFAVYLNKDDVDALIKGLTLVSLELAGKTKKYNRYLKKWMKEV